jgi:hypothetical protein
VRGKWLSIETLIQRQSLDEFRLRRVAFNMGVLLQARGTEGVSPITPFRISWDGTWADGDSEMQQHLVVTRQEPQA